MRLEAREEALDVLIELAAVVTEVGVFVDEYKVCDDVVEGVKFGGVVN